MHLTEQTPALQAKSEKAKDLEAVVNDVFSLLKDAFLINFPSIKIIPPNDT
jgi:hypothetical protein